jgi:hypothetical protein
MVVQGNRVVRVLVYRAILTETEGGSSCRKNVINPNFHLFFLNIFLSFPPNWLEATQKLQKPIYKSHQCLKSSTTIEMVIMMFARFMLWQNF